MDSIVHGNAKRQTRLSDFHFRDSITTFLIVLDLFSVGLFLPLVFHAQRSSFCIYCKAGLLMLKSLTFAWLESF